MNNQRILYIDYVKALAMILVVMGHVNFANADVKAWIYSFHMPAFFFFSGLVLKVEDISLKDTLRNKFIRLMLPYFLWGMFYAKFSILNFLKIVYGSSVSIASSGSLSSLWFLPVLFMALVLFYLFCKTGLAQGLVFKILVLIVAFIIGGFIPHLRFGYPWGIDVAITAFAFLLLGNICRVYFDKLCCYFKGHPLMGFVKSVMLFLLMLVCTLTYQLNNTSGVCVLMKNASYGDYSLFVLTAFFGIIMLFFLGVALELLNERGFKSLKFIGQNTLVIFVVHKPIIGCFNVLFCHFPIPDALALIITTIISLLLSCCCCIIINKHAPILAGR